MSSGEIPKSNDSVIPHMLYMDINHSHFNLYNLILSMSLAKLAKMNVDIHILLIKVVLR